MVITSSLELDLPSSWPTKIQIWCVIRLTVMLSKSQLWLFYLTLRVILIENMMMLKCRYFAYCGGIYSVCRQYWDKYSCFFKLSVIYLQWCEQRSLSKAFKIVFTFLWVLVILKTSNLEFHCKLNMCYIKHWKTSYVLFERVIFEYRKKGSGYVWNKQALYSFFHLLIYELWSHI